VEHEVRAKIEVINAYSAHADQGELQDFFEKIPKKPARAFVVHGEIHAAEAVAFALRRMGIAEVNIPARGDVFPI